MNEHWTDDTERVERYVLGKIPADERAQLDAHLNVCARCRDIVGKEQLLAHGIRAFGRSHMKERMGQLLLEESRSTVPWPHIVSIAAVLLIVVGLSVVVPWWGQEAPVVKDSEVAIQEDDREEEVEHAGPVERSAPERQPEEREEAQMDLQDMDEVRPPVPAAQGVDAYDAGAPGRQDLSGEQWIAGRIIADRSRRPTALDKRAQEARPESAARAKTLAGSGESRTRGQRISVTRQTVEELPPEQSTLLQAASVPARVRQTPDLIELVVFTDSLLAGDNTLSFEQVSGDSIVVFINGSVIGYRIPHLPVQMK